MKKFLLAALLAGVATSALAADLPTRKAPPAPAPVYAPAFSWTGFYVGVNGGYAVGSGGGDFGSPSGGFVGGTAGYNYQMGQYVLGVEGDWDWASLTQSGVNTVGAYNTNIDDLVTVRARAGYAVDRTLFFVTAGYAGVDSRLNFPAIGSQTQWLNGGAVGGGIEYAFTNNISAKAEYLFLPLQTQWYLGQRNTPDLSLFRVGLNYKF